jgi:hypothetical protein
MKTLNKEFVYKTFRFNIKVELNHNGNILTGKKGRTNHKITINDLGTSNWYKTAEIDAKEPEKMEVMIAGLENMAQDFVEERLQIGLSELEIKLMQLGFK